MTDTRLMMGVFAYHKEIPVELLETVDFGDKRTSDQLYEIFEAGMKHRLDYDREFNQGAYAGRISTNKRMSENGEQKKLLHFSYGDEDDYGRQRGVDINSIEAVDDSYESLENSDEIRSAIKDVRIMHKVLLYSEGVNLKIILENAIDGVEVAINKLKYIFENFELLGERIKILLEADICIPELL